MKISHLAERIKGYAGGKTVFSGLAAAFCLVLVLFVVFHGGKAEIKNAQGPGVSVPQAAKNAQPSGRATSQDGDAQGGSGQNNNGQNNKMSLEIVPGQAYAGTVLHLAARGFNLSGAQVFWQVNGIEQVTGSPSEFSTKGLLKGDVVRAAASVNGMEVKSGSVTIGDAPLVITRVRLMPEVFRPGDNLYVDVRAAGDSAENIVYEWTVNGRFAGNSNSLGMPVKRGDNITVKVTPCGPQGCGQTVVLKRRIENMPPMFSRKVSTTFDGTLYTAQLSATDPDGDPITYSLEGAPQGMRIDPSSGLIEWKVPPGVKGAQITAIANDGHGGTSEMTLNIKPQ